MVGLLVGALVLSQFPVDENPAAFELIERRDGQTLWGRPVPGSVFREYRVQTTSPDATADLCEAIYEWATRDADAPGVVSSRVLVDGADERVIYAQVAFPIVSRRDYVLVVTREALEGGRCRIRFRTTTKGAPPRPDGFVRMEKLWGEWLIDPRPDGGAALTHTLYSDPAGSVPSFLVHGDQRAATLAAVARGLAKTRAFVAQKRSLKR